MKYSIKPFFSIVCFAGFASSPIHQSEDSNGEKAYNGTYLMKCQLNMGMDKRLHEQLSDKNLRLILEDIRHNFDYDRLFLGMMGGFFRGRTL